MTESFGQIQCTGERGCGQTIALTHENTIVVCFVQPTYQGYNPFQHIVVDCPCGAHIRYFTDNDDIQTAIQHGCTTALGAYPDDEVIAGWYKANNIRPVSEVELTPRMEVEIQALGSWLETAPDEWVAAMFSEPAPPQERPETWI